MNKPHVALKIGISVLTFFAVSYWLLDFLTVDDCLDHGGRINEVTGACETIGEFIPLIKRTSFLFWLFIFLAGMVPTSIAYWLLVKFIENEK